MDFDHIMAIMLLVAGALMLAGGLTSMLRREREIEAAKLRHPSARIMDDPAVIEAFKLPEMTDAERRYHSSNQFGR